MTKPETTDQTRRTFVKTAAYVAPVILTLKATPALAHNGSHEHEEEESADAHVEAVAAPLPNPGT